MKRIVLGACVVLAGCGGCKPDRAEEELTAANVEVLEDPDTLELIAIENPPYDVPRTGTLFDGYPLVGRFEVTDEDTRKRFGTAFLDSIRASDGTAAMCYDPHHAFRATRDGRVVEMTICFHCFQTIATGNIGVSATIAAEPLHAVAREIYQANGLREANGAGEFTEHYWVPGSTAAR